ncbi:ECF RNA polymerase sigma factor SigR [Pirellulimonas nuda]|uniref:ECF RNA polymerase sigma factor SigR n=1 Tax=Pirellulimonas nuda TaxID=2528009 RepID=A0A518D5V6_9BACT|nr:sigma-70 family RNA polymerase sigma factor [Pirellulimonas nuda]QDU86855.1 ECF RNA polymerase sigma factor SigR [Pirellulimonas nuda]
MPPPAAATILSAMATSDPQPAAALIPADAFAQHAPWLRGVLLARLRDPHAAEEALQEVATALARDGARLRDPAKLGPWLYRVAVVTALQHRRREGRRRKRVGRYWQREGFSEHDDQQPDPLDWLLEQEQRTLVRTALDRLPTRDAEILLLKYSQDWSYQQIADHLGLRLPAVEGRLHRARKRLRGVLVAADPSLAVSHS